MAVGLTLKNGLYQNPLDKLGIVHEEIPDDMAHDLDESIFSLMEGNESKDQKKVALDAINYLRKQGVDGIILGCTEIPLLLEDSAATDLINPSEILAQAAVRKSIGLM